MASAHGILAGIGFDCRFGRRDLLRGAIGLGAGSLLGLGGCDVVPEGPLNLASLNGLRGPSQHPRIAALFPRALDMLPWIPLADALPTAVAMLGKAGPALGVKNLWIKRDDASSSLYGGNKVRKLEFLLADAVARGATRVITMGAIGSHHCYATTAFAAHLGLPTTIVQTPQPVTDHVRTQLLLDADKGADFRLAAHEPGQIWRIWREFAAERAAGGRPYFIWAGGSSALGTLGFVEAALELAAQVRDGAMPEPEAIFVAAGSGGSLAGLILGLRLAGMRSRAIGVRVVPPIITNAIMIDRLATGARAHLHACGEGPLLPTWTWGEIEILPDQMGPGYGIPTEESLRVQRIIADTEGIVLETTYTAKTLAGLVEWASRHPRHGPLLFWNTFSSTPLPSPLPGAEALPPEYQRFFRDDHSGT